MYLCSNTSAVRHHYAVESNVLVVKSGKLELQLKVKTGTEVYMYVYIYVMIYKYIRKGVMSL